MADKRYEEQCKVSPSWSPGCELTHCAAGARQAVEVKRTGDELAVWALAQQSQSAAHTERGRCGCGSCRRSRAISELQRSLDDGPVRRPQSDLFALVVRC